MDKVLTKIYETTNYNKFKFDKLNRRISYYRVSCMIDDLKTQKTIPPIEVEKKGESLIIIDGQHRFEALKMLNYPVPYFESYAKKNITTYDLYQRNKGQRWSTNDIIKSYAVTKKEYGNLSTLINWVTQKLGRVSNRATIELSSGIDDALEQNYDTKKHDYKQGHYKMLDKKTFKKTIEQIANFEAKIGTPIELKAASYKAIFTLMTIKDLDLNFLVQISNKQPLAFINLLNSNNATKVLKEILDFYNTQAMIDSKDRLKYVEGVHGLVLQCNYEKKLYL